MRKPVLVISAVVLAILSFATLCVAGEPLNMGEGLKQFRSGGHVLGFEQGGMLLASRDHMARVEMVGANPVAPVVGEPLNGDADESGAMQGAAPLSSVSYPEVWDGVTVTYDSDGEAVVKTTYYVEAGAGESAIDCIRLRYNRPVMIDKNGNLVLSYDMGQIIESAPVAFQDIEGLRKPVAVAYRILDDGEVGFNVNEEYDPAYPLVFDCVVVWNTFLGGGGTDVGYGIALDASGNVYVSGNSTATWGAPMRAYTAGYDAFAAKLSSTGTLSWSTFLGGSGIDTGWGIALDASGNVYVSGYSTATWGAPVRTYTAGYDAFAAKLSSTGTLSWSTFLGGGGTDAGYRIAVDASGDVYVSGYSTATWGSPVRAYTGDDAFAAKLSSTGTLSWSTFLGGGGSDYGLGIAVDGSGNVYVSGHSGATWGSPVRAYTAGSDAFAVELSSTGTLLWSTFLGGVGTDRGWGIVLETGGHVLVTGSSNATWGSPVRAYTAGSDAFAAELSSTGTLSWHTFLGSSGDDNGYGISVDASGNVYVTGSSNATWGSPVRAYTAGSDAFAAKLFSTGTLLWSTFLGGVGTDDGWGIAFEAGGDVLVTGSSTATWGSPVRPYTGSDIFATKISATLDAAASNLDNPASGAIKCAGTVFSPKATFSNPGTASLTNLLVRYRIVGPAPTTGEVYNQTGIITSLNCGASSQVTLPPATISTAGTYTIYAKSELTGDEVPANDEMSGTLVVGSLAAPTGIMATSDRCDEILVAWDTVIGATSYNLFRGTACGTVITTFTSVSSPYDDMTASPGTAYHYWVVASDGICTSANSPCASGYWGAPLAPTNVAAIPSCTGNCVSWTGSAGATSYDVLRGTACGTVETAFTSVTTPFNDTAAIAGVVYQYWVLAKNDCGNSANSACATASRYLSPLPTVEGPAIGCVSTGALISTQNYATYQWVNDGSDISGATTSIYTVTATGSYSVRVTNSDGCTGTSPQFPVTIYSNPTPAISGASAGCADPGVALSTGSFVNYQWQKDGTDISGATLQTCTATTTGSYSVRVTDSNGCVGTSDGWAVTIYSNPVPSITGATTGCTMPGVVLSTGTFSVYQWLKDGADIAGATSQTFAATESGSYTVRVTDSNGCIGTSAGHSLTIHSNPTPTVTGNSSGCQTPGVTLDAGIYTGYQWLKDGIDITGATLQNYTATQDGTYSVRVTDSNGCIGTSSGHAVTLWVNPAPTITGNSSGCQTPGVALSTGAYSSYQWQKDGVDISGVTAQNYTATASGTYTVRVIDSNGCVGTSVGKVITAYANPTPTISGPSPACGSGTLSTGSFTTYAWYRNGSPVSGASGQTYFAPVPGTYTVRVTSPEGCAGTSAAFIISSNPAPVISGPSSGCTSVVLSTTPFSSYQWLNGGADIPGATFQTYTAYTNGTYQVRVTNSAGCTGTSASKAVTITTFVPATYGDNINTCPATTVELFTEASTSYQWMYNGVPINGATRQTYEATVSGNYSVRSTDGTGCEGTSADHVVFIDYCPFVSEVSPKQGIFEAGLVKSAESSTGYFIYFQRLDSVNGYNIYEGNMGTYYSHGSAPGNLCSATVLDLGSGEMRAEITPSAGNHYYLVTAFGEGSEGPSGFRSNGVEIDEAQSTCAP